MTKKKQITIIGAGLVGSLLSIYLQRRGYQVAVYERRADLRNSEIQGGKSINLALSNRGWRPLKEVGIEDQLQKLIIPMFGRMMHDHKGTLSFQPYGKEGQAINSISRGGLNALLMNKAEESGVKFHFNFKCSRVDFERTIAYMEGPDSSLDVHSDLIFGADGAFSAIRQALEKTDRFDYSQHYITHGYKEFSFPVTQSNKFAFDEHALHIWPRKKFMLIALPNQDKSFTVTLFLPFEGENSFANLDSNQAVNAFFEKEFPDAISFMPNLIKEYNENPAASLVTVRSYPWFKNQVGLIGDAAHAIVPFYGQGMNAGFEDCYVLNQLLDQYDDNWDEVLKEFQISRKPDADAIAELAIENFEVMRDKVADDDFLVRKEIEAHLYNLYPDQWIPLYSMVTFNEDIRYSEALAKGIKQRAIMERFMKTIAPGTDWRTLDLSKLIQEVSLE